ncbi:MAG TPA: response regulator [Phycisphaerae bacterium]|nr:response regulator [Phycisphaerae bacterium]
MIGKKCFTVKNHKIPCRECAALSTLRSKEPHSCVLEVNNKNILIKAVPVFDEDVNIISVVETIQDISSQVKARKEAVNKMEMFQLLLDMLPAGILIINSDRQIVNANRYALDLLGVVTFDNIKGTLCHNRICPEADSDCPILNADKKVESRQCRILTIQGQELPVLKTVRPVNYMGEEMVVEVFLDMRQHNMYVDNLLQTEKLQAVALFAKGLAGEFTSKTADIFDKIAAMKKELSDNKCLKLLDSILNTTLRISEISDKLISFSRMDIAGSAEVDLHEVIRHISVYMEHTLREEGIEMKINLSARHHVIVGDSLHLERSILNLCSNSQNAMPDGGTLIIATTNENIDESSLLHAIRKLPVGRYVRVQVIDTGHGIAPEVQSHIFEPFFSTRSTASGVGLSAVFGTIKAHNGSIDVNSTPGLGTTFNIYLPVVSKSKTSADSPAEPAAVDNSRYEILVVDDDQIARTIISEMLRRMGYGVSNAASGREAVDIYLSRRNAIKLILLDITMPDMSGREVFDIIREKDPDVKIMILSADLHEENVNYILNAGGMGYLAKPVTQKNLQIAISRALDGMMTLPADLN